MKDSPAEPLYDLIRKTRHPATLREIMAVCVRHIYMGNPIEAGAALPQIPQILMDEVQAENIEVSGVRCVVYKPKSASVGLLIYMHGGGFVFGCSEDTDYITRTLCHTTLLTVISVNYRLAPETPFPGAADDCLNALDWALSNKRQLGFNANNVFVAGDSAGGNLAAAVALRLHARKTPAAGAILLAPWLDMHLEQYKSYNELAHEGIVYDAPFMGFARSAYARFEQWRDPLVSPIFARAADFPPTIILVGTDDPLVDQSKRFSEQAKSENQSHIKLALYPGMPHCFYSLPGLFGEEVDCYSRIKHFVAETSSK